MEAMSKSTPPTRREVVLRFPPGTKRALIAGFIAAATPWLVLQILGVVTVVTQSDNPWLVEVSLADQMSALTRVWAGGYFVPLTLDALARDLTITLAPWGMTLAYIAFAALVVARRQSGWAPWVALPSYVVTVLAIGATSPGLHLSRLIFAAIIVATLGVGWALVRIRSRTREQTAGTTRPSVPRFTTARERDRQALALGIDQGRWRVPVGARWVTIPGWLGSGCALGLRALGVLGLFGFALVVMAFFVSHDRVGGVLDLLPLDPWGYVVLVLAHLAYAPTFVTWAYAWLIGPGFTLGEGSHFSSFVATAGPIPAIPAFVAAPQVHIGWWAVALTIVLAALAGGWLGTTQGRDAVRVHCLQMLSVAATVAAGLAVAVRLSSGSIGSERLAVIGVDGLTVWGCLLGAVVFPATVVAIVMHPGVREAMIRTLTRARAGLSGAATKGAAAVSRRAPKEAESEVAQPPADDAHASPQPDSPAGAPAEQVAEQKVAADRQGTPADVHPARIAHVERDDSGPIPHTRLRAGAPAERADDTETAPIDFAEHPDDGR